MAKKKLLIYAHYYIPDTASTGQILRELAEGMLDKFDITVICVVPSYLGTIEDKYKTQKYYEEEINGVKVLRIRVPEFSKTNKKSRVKNIVSYFFGAMGATFKVGKMDYVFSISQPPILGGVERKRVEMIAADFNEYIANEPKVSFRDGKYYVVNGQHTIEGRILRNGGEDLSILCKVYTGLTMEQEALLFAEQNGHSAPLTAGIKLRAKVVGD